MAVFAFPYLFSILISSVSIPPRLRSSGLKLVWGTPIHVPVQSDEVKVGTLWILVLFCTAPPSRLSSPIPSVCAT